MEKQQLALEKHIALEEHIRTIPNFPVPGVEYKDITTLLQNPAAFQHAVDRFARRYQGQAIDVIAGVESRGFLFSGPIAYQLGAALVPIRKHGRLPSATYEVEYYLHFGADRLQIHRDAFTPGARVVVFDDLLASGRTLTAACELIEMAGGTVAEVACLIELPALGGRARLSNYPVFALLEG